MMVILIKTKCKVYFTCRKLSPLFFSVATDGLLNGLEGTSLALLGLGGNGFPEAAAVPPVTPPSAARPF